MSSTRLVVVTVAPSSHPWQMYFADAVGSSDDMSLVCELDSRHTMTATECAAIEDMLFFEHHVVVTSPWRYEIEWWDADIEVVRDSEDGPTQFRRHFAYRTIPLDDSEHVTVSLMHSPVYAAGVPTTQRLFTHDSNSTASINLRLRESGATVASKWTEAPGGRLLRARVVLGRDFPEEFSFTS